MLSVLHSQYHTCWWSGNFRSQGITNADLSYLSFSFQMACAVKPPDQPDTLWEQCLDYIVENLHSICDQGQYHPQQRKWTLKPFVYLTQDISDALLDKFHEKSLVLNDQLLNIFADTEKCRLQKVNLLESTVSDRTFASLMKHEPTEVNIKGCQNLTTTSLLSIDQHGSNLTALSLGLYWNIFSELDLQEKGERNSQILKELMETGLSLPHIRSLSIRNLTCLWQDNDALLTWILTPLLTLTQLDLTDSEIVFEESPNIGNLTALRHLCLHGVIIKNLDAAIDILIKLRELRYVLPCSEFLPFVLGCVQWGMLVGGHCWGCHLGGHFKNAGELLNLRVLKFSPVNKMYIFQCMGMIFCVEFQRVPLKFHTKYLTHTLKDDNSIQCWKFKSSQS